VVRGIGQQPHRHRLEQHAVGRGRANLGVHRLVGEAPAGAVEAIVSYNGREHRVPVSADGCYIFAAWGVPADAMEQEEPQALRYVQADGSVITVPEDELAHDRQVFARLRKLMHERHGELSPGEISESIEFLPDDEP
jgi:hypothetical protein